MSVTPQSEGFTSEAVIVIVWFSVKGFGLTSKVTFWTCDRRKSVKNRKKRKSSFLFIVIIFHFNEGYSGSLRDTP